VKHVIYIYNEEYFDAHDDFYKVIVHTKHPCWCGEWDYCIDDETFELLRLRLAPLFEEWEVAGVDHGFLDWFNESVCL